MNGNATLGLHLTSGATLTSSRADGVQYLYGNLWENITAGAHTALHEGTDAQIANSKFKTHDATLPIFPEGYVAPLEDAFYPWFAANEQENDRTGCEDLSQSEATDWLTDYALADINYAVYDTMLKQQGQYLAHDFMYRNPGLSYSPTLQNFYTNFAGTDAGQVSQIRVRLERALDISPGLDSLIRLYQDSIVIAQDQLNTLQLTLGSDPTPTEIQTYQVQSLALSTQIYGWKQHIKSLHQAHAAALDDTLVVLYIAMTLLSDPVDNIPMHNAFTETGIEVLYLLAPSLGLLPAEISALLTIAHQCPDYGGQAVYWSRALLNRVYPDLIWDDGLLCADTLGYQFVPPPIQALSRINDGYRSYPNPSTGYLMLSAPAEYSGMIELLDSRGSILYRHTYDVSSRIALPDYTGVVFIKWMDQSGNLLHLGRHIILK